MVNGNITQKIRAKIKASPETVILALEEKGFCVGLLKNGKTIKKEGREIKDISERFSRLGEIYGARVRSSSSPLWYRERFYYSRLYSLAPSSLTTHKP